MKGTIKDAVLATVIGGALIGTGFVYGAQAPADAAPAAKKALQAKTVAGFRDAGWKTCSKSLARFVNARPDRCMVKVGDTTVVLTGNGRRITS